MVKYGIGRNLAEFACAWYTAYPYIIFNSCTSNALILSPGNPSPEQICFFVDVFSMFPDLMFSGTLKPKERSVLHR